MTITDAGRAHLAQIQADTDAHQHQATAERLGVDVEHIAFGDFIFSTERRGDTQKAGVVVQVHRDKETGVPDWVVYVDFIEYDRSDTQCPACGGITNKPPRWQTCRTNIENIAELHPATNARLQGLGHKLIHAGNFGDTTRHIQLVDLGRALLAEAATKGNR